VTIAQNNHGSGDETEVQKYLEKSGLLKEKPHLLRMDVMGEDANEGRIIEGIKHLIGE